MTLSVVPSMSTQMGAPSQLVIAHHSPAYQAVSSVKNFLQPLGIDLGG